MPYLLQMFLKLHVWYDYIPLGFIVFTVVVFATANIILLEIFKFHPVLYP